MEDLGYDLGWCGHPRFSPTTDFGGDRATEATGEIGERIALARHQLEQAHRGRYMVRNDEVVRATEVLAAIVERELELAASGSLRGR